MLSTTSIKTGRSLPIAYINTKVRCGDFLIFLQPKGTSCKMFHCIIMWDCPHRISGCPRYCMCCPSHCNWTARWLKAWVVCCPVGILTCRILIPLFLEFGSSHLVKLAVVVMPVFVYYAFSMFIAQGR